jgi:hypothetical protein
MLNASGDDDTHLASTYLLVGFYPPENGTVKSSSTSVAGGLDHATPSDERSGSSIRIEA